MEEKCYAATIGAGNKIESEAQLSSFLGCIMVLGPQHPPAPPSLAWQPVGSSVYSYNCGTMNATASLGGVEMSSYGQIDGYPYGGLFVTKARQAECPSGFARVTGSDGSIAYCSRPTTHSCEAVSDPMSIASGEKTLSETDYAGFGLFPLEFKRSYSNVGFYRPVAASSEIFSGFGDMWRHSYDRRIIFENSKFVVASALRPSGLVKHFRSDGREVLNQDGAGDKLIPKNDASGKNIGWLYVDANGTTEAYDSPGNLLRITALNGQTQSLAYSDATTPPTIARRAGLLIKVTDQFGRQLNFTYDSKNRMSSMTTPNGETTRYEFDANENLQKVVFPDSKAKIYAYNDNAAFASNGGKLGLTGVIDENGTRVSNFSYRDGYWNTPDITEEAGGVGRYTRTISGNSVIITDPIETQRIYGISNIQGVLRVTSQSQPGGAGCPAASLHATFDANGNIKTRTDFNGVVTNFQFDLTRNLETSRSEAAGSALQRTTTTEWHANLPIRKRVAEPLLITTMTHDASGNVVTRTLQPTNDANGALGFAATRVGPQRIWRFTYNAFGQLLTATGPRTDIVDLTTYTFDTSTGNLKTMTNTAGQKTNFNDYDANGQLKKLTDPNGLVTTMTYSSRGWLLSTSVQAAGGTESQTSSFTYDGAGQLKMAMFADGQMLAYRYDDSHRLIEIGDLQNNKITYTLDKLGNRIGESARDPARALARSVSATYDALNRLKDITGTAPQSR